MRAMGYTLNQITMLALTLMVGIVIDDAIVVLENIYRFIEEKGMPPFQAAIEGTKRDRARGHGDDAVADGGVRAGRLHGRHRRPVHVLVRADGGVRDRRLAARLVHADADALLAVHQDPARQARAGSAPRIARSRRSSVRSIAPTWRMLRLVDGASRASSSLTCVLVIASIVPLFMVDRQELRAGRRPVASSRSACAPPKARVWPRR